MYNVLENQYNNNGLLELENKLEGDKRQLRNKYEESKSLYTLQKHQDKYLKREESKNRQAKGRISNHVDALKK